MAGGSGSAVEDLGGGGRVGGSGMAPSVAFRSLFTSLHLALLSPWLQSNVPIMLVSSSSNNQFLDNFGQKVWPST